MKASVLRYAAIGMASLSLAGFAAASTTVNVSGNLPASHNKVNLSNKLHVDSTNTNVAGVSNFSAQGAASGDVKAKTNGIAGNVGSGNAANDSKTTTEVTVDNTGATTALGALGGGMGGTDSFTISGNGPDSKNNVTVKNSAKVNLTNTNVAEVNNATVQGATTGNAKASENGTVGNVTSGAASNTSETKTTVKFTN